jgi:hypothetical protein
LSWIIHFFSSSSSSVLDLCVATCRRRRREKKKREEEEQIPNIPFWTLFLLSLQLAWLFLVPLLSYKSIYLFIYLLV